MTTNISLLRIVWLSVSQKALLDCIKDIYKYLMIRCIPICMENRNNIQICTRRIKDVIGEVSI